MIPHTFRGPRSTARACLLVSALLALPALALAAPDKSADAVLVAGAPPLTRSRVEGYARFLEWVLDSALTESQRGDVEAMLVAAWQAPDRAPARAALDMLVLRDRVAALPEAQRDMLRAQALPRLLEAWRSKPDDESARWALAVYEAAHQPLAAGTPPLTRQASDAYAEAVAFAAREITQRPFRADAAFKDEIARHLVAVYAELAPRVQAQVADSALLWAAVRVAWPRLGEPERDALRKQWAAALGVASTDDVLGPQASRALDALGALDLEHRTTPLSPLEMRQAANNLEIVAERLRFKGTARDRELAARSEATARKLRAAAAGGPPGGRTAAYGQAVADLDRQHAAFVGLMNASLIQHAGTMNMIPIMSGSPYRYTVR